MSVTKVTIDELVRIKTDLDLAAPFKGPVYNYYEALLTQEEFDGLKESGFVWEGDPVRIYGFPVRIIDQRLEGMPYLWPLERPEIVG